MTIPEPYRTQLLGVSKIHPRSRGRDIDIIVCALRKAHPELFRAESEDACGTARQVAPAPQLSR